MDITRNKPLTQRQRKDMVGRLMAANGATMAALVAGARFAAAVNENATALYTREITKAEFQARQDDALRVAAEEIMA